MKSCLSLLIVLCCLPAMAQIQFQSLSEVLNFADARAIAIQSGIMGEQIALAKKKEARSYLLPSLNTSLGYNDNITLQPTLVPAQFLNPAAPENELTELTFGTKYQYTGGIQAKWDVLNFQRIFALQTANKEWENSKIQTEVHRYNTYNLLASTYYSIVLTQESIRIHEENVKVAASIFELAQEKYREGIINESERNRAEISQLQSQKNLNLAKNNLDQLYLQLQSQLNTSEPIRVTDSPERFVLADTTITQMHPEILWQEAEVKKHEYLVKQTKAVRLPSLSLLYQNNRTWATNDFMGFSEANTLPQQSFGVKLSFSELLGGSTRQKIQQSEDALQLQQMQLNNARLVKQKEDELLQLQLEQASDQLTEHKQILALQQKNDAHAEYRYQGGLMSLDQRLDSYDDLLVSQDNYLQSLAAYTLAQYKIYIRQINFQPK